MASFVRVSALSMLLVAGSAIADTIYYPSQKDAQFTVESPDDWEQRKEKGEDGIVRIWMSGNSGAAFQIGATTYADKNELESLIADETKSTRDYLKETFKDVEFQNPKPMEGKDGVFFGSGTGVYKEDGKKYEFMNIISTDAGEAVEMWAEWPTGDQEAKKQLDGILDSLKFKKKG